MTTTTGRRMLPRGAQIAYALAGGFAFSAWCQPRTTVDIDVVVCGELTEVERAAREAFASVYRNPLSMEYRLVRVHRLEPTDPAFGDAALKLTRMIPFRGSPVPVAGPEVLYVLKRASTRPQDLADAEQLLAAHGARFDTDFVKRWDQ